MAKAPYFSFFVRDWMCSRKVSAMSGEAVKAYLYLLCESWLQEPRATLPNNDDELASMARVSLPVFLKMKKELLRHFKIGQCDDHKGLYYNEKLLEISRKYEGNQRVGNKNAKRSRINTEHSRKNALHANANAIDNDIDNDPEEEEKNNTNTKAIDWKTDFETYKKEAFEAGRDMVLDEVWIAERERYHPGLNIKLTLEKAWKDYWTTEAGWKNKKMKRTKTIDWKRTANNALSQKSNQVWKKREEVMEKYQGPVYN